MNKLIKNLGTIFLIFISISILFALYNSEKSFNKTEEISLGRLVEEIRNDQVKKITVAGEKLSIELKDSKKQSAVKEKESSLLETLKNYGLESEKLQSVEISMEGESGISYWLATILPILLPFI
ncbi:MAG: cell division protein FtsH, partial [Candidatus Moranbacteria bacterium]|nr:cell division protein FtsH [Candidatus Moranbacteria bacterium]